MQGVPVRSFIPSLLSNELMCEGPTYCCGSIRVQIKEAIRNRILTREKRIVEWPRVRVTLSGKNSNFSEFRLKEKDVGVII